MDVVFNSDGTPLLTHGSRIMMVTNGKPTTATDAPTEDLAPMNINWKFIVRWCDLNNYPIIA